MACRLIGACAVIAAALLPVQAAAFELITPVEAALPAAPAIGHESGISRGPTVLVDLPQPGAGTIKSPLDLKIRFAGHGGATINLIRCC